MVSFLVEAYLPADELCLLVFESGSSEVVDAAVERAGIRFERIPPALEAQTDWYPSRPDSPTRQAGLTALSARRNSSTSNSRLEALRRKA